MSVSNEFQAQDMQLQPAGSFVRAKNVACRRRQGAVAKTAHCSKWHFFSGNTGACCIKHVDFVFNSNFGYNNRSSFQRLRKSQHQICHGGPTINYIRILHTKKALPV